MNFTEYNHFNLQAEEAERNGRLREAADFYMAAAQALLEWAMNLSGKQNRELRDHADDIIAYAERLSSTEKNAAPKNATPAKPSGKSKTLLHNNYTDGEETVSTKFYPVAVPNIGFDDVAGLDDVKKSIYKRVIYPMKYPDIYQDLRKKVGGGVLMFGTPGTGKTTIAMATAKEAGAAFYHIKVSDILDKWVGEAEKNIRELFATAKQHKAAIIFFDDIEGLFAKRGSNSTIMNHLIPELLVHMQGFEQSDNDKILLIMGATNRPWEMDTGFRRSGRFDDFIYIPPPDLKARKYLLEKKYAGIPLDSDIDLDELALKTEGFSGADITLFCDRSSDFSLERRVAIRKKNGGRPDKSEEFQIVTKEDVLLTLKDFTPTINQKDIEQIEKFRLNPTAKNIKNA